MVVHVYRLHGTRVNVYRFRFLIRIFGPRTFNNLLLHLVFRYGLVVRQDVPFYSADKF